MVESWIKRKPNGNIALRMPPNLIGIDVDAYGEKAGAETLAAAEAEWGPLPNTWRTTSRVDGISGIRLFRVPEGLSWPGKLPQGGGVELCRWDHRYVIVAPSKHDKTGEQYHWFAPDGTRTTAGEDDAGGAVEGDDWEFPALDELPNLPADWVTGLTSGKKWTERPEEDLEDSEVTQWILDRPDGDLCEKMGRTLDSWMSKISAAGEDGGAHDAARDAAWAVLRDSAAGHVGVQKALARIKAAHKEALRLRRPEKSLAEWNSIKARGVRKVAAEGPTDDEDDCALGAVSHEARRRNRGGSADFEYARNDAGNARRFARRYRDAALWVDGLGGWHVWDPSSGLWRADVDGESTRMAIATVSAIEEEVKFLEDPKEQGKLRSFINGSSNEARLKAMLSLSRSQKGMTAPASQFNSDPAHFVVGNGTIELNGSGARLRRSRQEDFNTVGISVRYEPGVTSDLWLKFLDRSIPDPEVLDWVQRAAGYSLFGANPERLFFIVQGETSSGKSTFGEVLRDVLGAYGSPYELNLFRSQKEQGPNVQLVKLLPKRFILASEASAEVYLHADQLKRVTGGEALSGRLNRANEMVERVPAFTPWLVTNSAPTVRGADLALYRRIYTIPFNETIDVADEDKGLPYRLKTEEAPGVLSWLVAGWNRYCEVGLREIPEGIATATMKTREELSDFDAWLTEHCLRGPEEQAVSDELYANYTMWCEEASVKRESKIEFGRMLGKRGMVRKMVRIDPVDRDKKARGWAGLSLKTGKIRWA